MNIPKFRAWHISAKMMCEVLHIDLVNRYVSVLPEKELENGDQQEWDFAEIELMQSTGLQDKNGVEIYESDIIQWGNTKQYIQQSQTDVSPEINEPYLVLNSDVVVFYQCMFTCEKIKEAEIQIPILGFSDINEIKERLFDDEDFEEYNCDVNGTEISDKYVGIEVIGNIYQNPELLKSI